MASLSDSIIVVLEGMLNFELHLKKNIKENRRGIDI